jgi:hypothetical protein
MILNITKQIDIKTWKLNNGYDHLWFLLMWLHPSKFQVLANILTCEGMWHMAITFNSPKFTSIIIMHLCLMSKF